MSNEVRKVPVIFLSGNVGVSRSEKNQGKRFLSMDVTELSVSKEGEPYIRSYGQGEKRSLVMSYFKWLEEWSGTRRDFTGIKPSDIILLHFADSGISGGRLVDFELAESTDVVDKYFGI